MICNALLLREIRGRKNPKLKITDVIPQAVLFNSQFLPPKDIDKYEKCEGNVEISVVIERDYDEGDGNCFDNYGWLAVECKCEVCNNTHFPELTNEASYGMGVDKFIKKFLIVPEEEHEKFMEQYKDSLKKHEKLVEQSMKNLKGKL